MNAVEGVRMGPKTSDNTGTDFQRKVEKLFELEEEEEETSEKEDGGAGDKNAEDE
jgi:hypothetical protein